MQLQPGLQPWRCQRAKINKETKGIVWLFGWILHWSMWISPAQWVSLALPEDRHRSFTEWYVFAVMLLSVGIYLAPTVGLAWFNAYFSAGTIIVMLHIVLLQQVFGSIASAERSLLLFMCNVVQIVFMFATWYYLCRVPDPLIKAMLTFATINYAEEMKPVAMIQIATDFVLLFIFLAFLLSQLGPKNGAEYEV